MVFKYLFKNIKYTLENLFALVFGQDKDKLNTPEKVMKNPKALKPDSQNLPAQHCFYLLVLNT